MPSLREALLSGEFKNSSLTNLDQKEVLADIFYVAAHSTVPESVVLADSVRDALDYFSEEDGTLLLKRCAMHLAKVKKQEWEWPPTVSYQGDPLKPYIEALRNRKVENARFLAAEVVKHVGSNTLGEVWLHLSLESEDRRAFLVGSACRRALLHMPSKDIEALLNWTSSYLATQLSKKKVDVTSVAEYEELANDMEMMRRASSRAGENCTNLVFLHRIKQNINTLGRSYTGYLLHSLDKELADAKEMSFTKDRSPAPLDDLEKGLENKDITIAAAAINALCDQNEIDLICYSLLSFATTVGKAENPWPLIATHAACELARTMGASAALPLTRAAAYLFQTIKSEGMLKAA